MHHNELVFANYQRNYTLGLFPTEQNDWIVSLGLKMPCPFLENDLCSIYPVRPLACVLFPEYLVCDGRFEVEAGNTGDKA
jgi:Fe-S-cluster containining protein